MAEHQPQNRQSSKEQEALMAEFVETGLEVDVWLRCQSTEELWRFAESLDDPSDGSERVPPPLGRRNMILNWPHKQVEPDAEPWQDAFLYGIGQGQILVDQAREKGIKVEVYAVRVQPADAEFKIQTPATVSDVAA